MTTTTTINGRQYEITETNGDSYLLTGKRGASVVLIRNNHDGLLRPVIMSTRSQYLSGAVLTDESGTPVQINA